MKIEDSIGIKNRISLLSIVIAFVLYLAVSILTDGLALLVLLPCAGIAFYLSGKEIARAGSKSDFFKKMYPFSCYGLKYGDFEHVFHSGKNVESEIIENVIRDLKRKTPVQSVDQLMITDADKNLKAKDSRLFLKADAGQTQRGSAITLIMQTARFGSMQSVHWWVLCSGYINRNARFNFSAYAGLTIWFWIIPYFRKEYDLLSQLRTVYPASFDGMDITTRVRCLHETVFNAMIRVMENHDIDISDIKTQRAGIMNITVSGGTLSIGNLIQGAKNKIASGIATSLGGQS